MPITEYDPTRNTGAVNKEKYKGLRWRRTADGSYRWYVIQYMNASQNETQLKARTEKDAIREWRAFDGKRAEGKVAVPTGNAKLGDAWKLLAEERTTNEINWRLHIEPYFGAGKRFADLGPDEHAAFYVHLTEKGLSQNTQLTVRTTMNTLYKKAIRKEWIFENPYAKLEKHERPKKRTRPGYKPNVLRPEATFKMIEAVRGIYRNALIVLACTGLRISELCGLRWEDIDLEGEVLTVRTQLGGIGETKTEAGVRTVISLALALKALRAQRASEWEKGYGKAGDFVFTTTAGTGKPITQDNLRNRGVIDAGVKAGLGHIRPHDLRHTTASMLAAAGVSITAAARMMGHKLETFVKTYAHAFEDQKELAEIREALTKIGFGQEAVGE